MELIFYKNLITRYIDSFNDTEVLIFSSLRYISVAFLKLNPLACGKYLYTAIQYRNACRYSASEFKDQA